MDSTFSDKVKNHFGTLAVNKEEVRDIKSGSTLGMPGYVIEFLVGAARKKNSTINLSLVFEKYKPFLIDPDQTRSLIGLLMHEGKKQLISFLSVSPIIHKNEFSGEMPAFKEKFNVSPGLIIKYPELLTSGLWGSVSLEYDAVSDKKGIISIVDFKPYQLANPDIELFRSGRSHFSTEEWINLLIETLGYNSQVLTHRQKLLYLARLVPLVQGNVNLVELGPRGTAKSYLLSNLSHKVNLIAGAKITPASLIYNNQTRSNGALMQKQVVVFDEIANTEFSDLALIASLKDYMEEGRITRMGAGKSAHATCSLLFSGNIDVNSKGLPHDKYYSVFSVLPDKMQDTALYDRFHGLIPGWEMPKIRDELLSSGIGLLSDYFGSVLSDSDKNGNSIRKEQFAEQWLRQNIALSANESSVTLRDQKAIFRIGSGLLKMVFPDNNIRIEDLNPLMDLAVELRQRVVNEMSKVALGEFPKKNIKWELK